MTPPFAFTCLTRSWAAASAGPSNGAIAPLLSNAQPIVIGDAPARRRARRGGRREHDERGRGDDRRRAPARELSLSSRLLHCCRRGARRGRDTGRLTGTCSNAASRARASVSSPPAPPRTSRGTRCRTCRRRRRSRCRTGRPSPPRRARAGSRGRRRRRRRAARGRPSRASARAVADMHAGEAVELAPRCRRRASACSRGATRRTGSRARASRRRRGSARPPPGSSEAIVHCSPPSRWYGSSADPQPEPLGLGGDRPQAVDDGRARLVGVAALAGAGQADDRRRAERREPVSEAQTPRRARPGPPARRGAAAAGSTGWRDRRRATRARSPRAARAPRASPPSASFSSQMPMPSRPAAA